MEPEIEKMIQDITGKGIEKATGLIEELSRQQRMKKDFVAPTDTMKMKMVTSPAFEDQEPERALELKFDETDYFKGTETPEYAEICKKLKAMKTLGELQAEEDALIKKYYFPMKLAGNGKNEDEAWADAVDAFNNDPGIMDGYEETDEDLEY